ncbi:RICIN domain-containing protein [Flexibacterium corallicola]|uniref:RICIN domain-containing protein n=1 Tax=Flexibacterium corallicola TaxID=3037259 RepID=UPI00286F8652|nr:RICIN domain-containing protein [Pseudovibrio sp. M1P-2-3]
MGLYIQRIYWACILSAVFCSVHASAAEQPHIQTPAPVIHLADNFGETRELGWCIDTIGKGFAENLHAHSCKPQGGDVQFSYDAKTGKIRSVAYPKFCMTYQSAHDLTLTLTDCEASNTKQQFSYNLATKEIRLGKTPDQCIVVGEPIRTAGPFMSRDLIIQDCSTAGSRSKEWVIVP